MEIKLQFPQKELNFNFVFTKVLLKIRHFFRKGLIEHWKVQRTELIQIFIILGQQARKYGNKDLVTPQRVNFQFCFYQSFTENKTFPKGSH